MSLIGRVPELRVVSEHLRARRNLAVCGGMGVGKTALVREAAMGVAEVVYCADTTTLKRACESLREQLGLSVMAADNVQRKRAILRAARGRPRCFIFDHVGWVSPKLLSLLQNLHEAHTLVVVERNLASAEIGHLKMIMWNFDTLEIGNLPETDARTLVRQEIARRRLTPPDPVQFERDAWRLTKGNPGRIIGLCEQASKGCYVFGDRTDLKLVELDRRIHELPKS